VHCETCKSTNHVTTSVSLSHVRRASDVLSLWHQKESRNPLLSASSRLLLTTSYAHQLRKALQSVSFQYVTVPALSRSAAGWSSVYECAFACRRRHVHVAKVLRTFIRFRYKKMWLNFGSFSAEPKHAPTSCMRTKFCVVFVALYTHAKFKHLASAILEICSASTIGKNFPQLPSPSLSGDQDPHLTQCSMAPRSVHPKQHLDLFSLFCTVKPSWAAWQTDRQTERHRDLR